MLEHFFYGDKTISRNDIEEMIFTMIVREGNGVIEAPEDSEDSDDAEVSIADAYTALLDLHKALYPDEDTLSGDKAEQFFVDCYVKAYISEIGRSQYALKDKEGKLRKAKDILADPHERDSFLEHHYVWIDDLDWKHEISKRLIVEMAKVHAGAQAGRSVATYDAFREYDAKQKGAVK